MDYGAFVEKGTNVNKASQRAQDPRTLKLLLGALGMMSEAGEAAEHVKKFFFHGATLNPEALKKEMGDVRWYYQQILNYFDWTDEHIMQTNQYKLRARAPERYGDTFEELTCDSGICPEEQITCEECRMRTLMMRDEQGPHEHRWTNIDGGGNGGMATVCVDCGTPRPPEVVSMSAEVDFGIGPEVPGQRLSSNPRVPSALGREPMYSA